MTNIPGNVNKEEFLELSPGREDLWELLSTKPKDKAELITKYLPSKLWRLNNLYTITDKMGDPTLFVMNRAQLVVHSKVLVHPRLIILKSRQQGISTLWLISFFDDVLFRSHYKCGLMAQDREAATTLLERVKFTWDHVEPWLKEFLARKQTVDNASEFGFNNGSSLYIRTSFRSGTLQRLHISELGKIANKYPQKAKETNTGTLQAIKAGNIAVIESTAEGNNMFKQKWDSAVEQSLVGQYAGKDFMPVFLSWLDDPDCVEEQDQYICQEHADYFAQLEKELNRTITRKQKNFWVAQERELEGDIHQEYPATPQEAFAASKDGSFWARKYLEWVVRRRRVVDDLYDANLPVYCAMDLGRNDFNVLLFFQFWIESDGDYSIRFIGEYYNSGEGIDFYAKLLINEYAKELNWEIKEVALPHDGAVTDLSTKGQRTREDIMNEEGVRNTLILAKLDGSTSRDNVRTEIPHMWFDSRTPYVQSCMLRYSKEWNETLNIWRNDERHDEYSHGAAAVRYAVQYCIENLIPVKRSSAEQEVIHSSTYAGL